MSDPTRNESLRDEIATLIQVWRQTDRTAHDLAGEIMKVIEGNGQPENPVSFAVDHAESLSYFPSNASPAESLSSIMQCCCEDTGMSWATFTRRVNMMMGDGLLAITPTPRRYFRTALGDEKVAEYLKGK